MGFKLKSSNDFNTIDQIAMKENDREKIYLVYKNQSVTLPGSFLLGAFLVFWYSYLSEKILFYVLWYLLFSGFLGIRLWQTKKFFIEYNSTLSQFFNSKKWEYRINFSLIITSFFWSSLGVFNISQGILSLSILTILQIIGAAATGIIAYPGYRFVTTIWTPLVVFPLAIPTLLGPVEDIKPLVVSMGWFYLAMLASMKMNNEIVLSIFKEKEKNRNLAKELNATLIDIQQKNEQIQMIQQRQIQSSRMVALGEMAGGIAHEINTPLMSIHLLSAHLKKMIASNPFNSTNVEQASTKIETIADKISFIIKGLGVFSRESNSDDFKSVSFLKILHETLAISEGRINENEIKVALECRATDVEINGIESQLAQVVLHLLNNSIDAIQRQALVSMPQNNLLSNENQKLNQNWIRIGIENTFESDPVLNNLGMDFKNNFSEKKSSLSTNSASSIGSKLKYLKISIIDSGNGITPEIIDKIMQPFFTTKEIGKGTGLGLSTSQGILKNHNGKLYFDPSEKQTTFVILLPTIGQKENQEQK